MGGAVIRSLGPTFLRRPRGAEVVADVVRLLVLGSVPVAAIGWGPVALAVTLLALLGAVIPRMLGLRPGFDIALGLLSLIAAWSSTLDWYTTVFGWDKIVHTALVGALGVVITVIGADLGVVADPRRTPLAGPVVVCATAGLAIGAVWEMCEWVGHTYLDASIFVGYDDTIGDLLADLVGAVAAGFVVRSVVADRRVVEPA
jgi:hypothetical protein